MNRQFQAAAAAAFAMLACATAQAQPAGAWMVRAGVTRIDPHVTSGNLTAPSLPGTQSDIGASTQPCLGMTWMATNNIAIDVPLCTPFEHDIQGAGAIGGAGKIGETKALPVTVMAQYRFGAPEAKFRPYVGAGPTYAKFFKEQGTGTLTAMTGGTPATPTRLSIDSKWALTIQAGATIAINERWFLDAMVAKTFLKTRTTLSTGQTLDTKLDPVTLSVGVGYRF